MSSPSTCRSCCIYCVVQLVRLCGRLGVPEAQSQQLRLSSCRAEPWSRRWRGERYTALVTTVDRSALGRREADIRWLSNDCSCDATSIVSRILQQSRAVVAQLVKQAMAAGGTVFVVTDDSSAARRRETDIRNSVVLPLIHVWSKFGSCTSRTSLLQSRAVITQLVRPATAREYTVFVVAGDLGRRETDMHSCGGLEMRRTAAVQVRPFCLF